MSSCSNHTNAVCSWYSNTPAPPHYGIFFFEMLLMFLITLALACIVIRLINWLCSRNNEKTEKGK